MQTKFLMASAIVAAAVLALAPAATVVQTADAFPFKDFKDKAKDKKSDAMDKKKDAKDKKSDAKAKVKGKTTTIKTQTAQIDQTSVQENNCASVAGADRGSVAVAHTQCINISVQTATVNQGQ